MSHAQSIIPLILPRKEERTAGDRRKIIGPKSQPMPQLQPKPIPPASVLTL